MMRKTIIFIVSLFLLVNLIGCEAFVRKFTRKSKKEKAPEEMVLAPEEWKGPQMTKVERYRQYLDFWESWHDELINALVVNISQKKKLDCMEQATKNLIGMRSLLNESKQKQLDVYLRQMSELKNSIKSDIYGSNTNRLRQNADRLKMDIQLNFSFKNSKNDLI